MKNTLYQAIFKSVTGRLSTYIVQFASLAIYARLFTPEEFGIIASIQVFVIFFQMLADVGIGPAIINEKHFNNEQRDGVFTVTAITGLVVAVIFYFFSYVLNEFYNGYQYQSIAIFVCIAILFNSLNILPSTAMNKDARFTTLAGIDIFAELLCLVIIYSLYIQGGRIEALALRPAIQSIVKFLLTWFLSLNSDLGRARFGSELFHIKKILAFSTYQFGFNFINYFSRNLDNILIAKYFGMASVGVYDKAYQLMRYPLMITTFAMTPAIQPILTKVRDEKEKVIKEHNLLTARLLAIALPISVFMFMNSYNIVFFLFGEQWLQVEPMIKVFSLMIPIQAILSTSGSFFQVMNQPRLLFISGAIAAVTNVTAIVAGILFGEMIYIAVGLVFAFSLTFFQVYFTMFKFCFKSSSKEFYIKIIKVNGCLLPPLILYCLIQNTFLTNYNLSAFIDLLLNGGLGALLLVAFVIPIKKVLS